MGMNTNFINLLYSNNLSTIKDDKIGLLNVTTNPTELSEKEKQEYEYVCSIQTIFNELIYLAMKDKQEDIDDPIYKMVLKRIKNIKPEQNIKALFIRSDYLFEEEICGNDTVLRSRQIEINTISCAFSFMGPVINRVHSLYDSKTLLSDSDLQFVEMVKCIKEICSIKNPIFEEKNSQKTDNSSSPVAIMVDNDTSLNSSNIFEKLSIIKKLKEVGIDILHLTFDDIRKKCEFRKIKNGEILSDDEAKRLYNFQIPNSIDECNMFYEKRPVFFVYYRWFYNYKHYTESDIFLRTKIECSTAISLPSVELQIMGLKIFQIRFKNKDYLLKYLNNEEADKISKVFGDFYDYNKDKINTMDVNKYVLKSLEEGGGNNLYDEDIKNYEGDPKKVFLMKKINGKSHKNNFIKDGLDGKQREIVPEIGIMGWLIAEGDNIIYNKNAGYICRSKDVSSNECGVSCGYGALDSIKFKD